ncbi:helix-turn-helix transcriptional regulator [Clostridium sp. MB40-C1]|uniref:helix-turn-helix domain-containing protein n=1 Tax=Clostridium sp. MB40-C1 TaxID=3070996 RepID=UPI0027E0959D|nr:helix-turn-helix transcriptional regulator [Clostridium sp. MB40-C1]WMJ80961.1 helix-turn-helix transcriptional regulator [Clostridium sp. MB40-C1]
MYTLICTIKKYRLLKKLTQSQLAKKAGISKSYLSEIESGKKVPGKDVAKKLGTALKISPSEFMLWIDD